MTKLSTLVKATPTISWLRVDAEGLSNDGIRIGFTYGLVTEFKFSSNYAFATGIDVSYRGGKFKYSLGDDDVSFTQKLQFLDVPVALKLRTNEIGYMKYYGTFGFLPGVIIRLPSLLTLKVLSWTTAATVVTRVILRCLASDCWLVQELNII